MPRWAIKCIVGTTDFSNCRTLMPDNVAFLSQHRGSVAPAASGLPKAQTIFVGTRGNPITLNLPYCPAALLLALATEVNAANAANPPTTVRFQYKDALIDIDLSAFPDLNQGWVTAGPESEGIISNVTLRFISAS